MPRVIAAGVREGAGAGWDPRTQPPRTLSRLPRVLGSARRGAARRNAARRSAARIRALDPRAFVPRNRRMNSEPVCRPVCEPSAESRRNGEIRPATGGIPAAALTGACAADGKRVETKRGGNLADRSDANPIWRVVRDRRCSKGYLYLCRVSPSFSNSF